MNHHSATVSHAREILNARFGFSDFRPGQEAVISSLLAGRSAAAIFPTGSGKSLCYQLPALLLPGLTLVVSPLIALMKDQIDVLQARGIAAARLDSSLDEETYRRVMDDLREQRLKLLYVAPERLGNERFLALVAGMRISLLAVDEAHCISAWGHNFRPDYLKLSQAAKDLAVERVLALTATATPAVVKDMAEAFAIASDDVVNTGFYRPNLELRVSPCVDEQRPQMLLERLQARPPGPTIVYVTLQRQAEECAAHLRRSGLSAQAYHAGMAAEERVAVQNAFMSGSLPIICATIAFGMGVDKADIRYVYHYHLAKGFESYQQEIGRAGRDGKSSICELFACADDCTILENFVYGDTPDAKALAGLVNEVLAEDTCDCAIYELSRRYDLRSLVVNTLLTHLELDGWILNEGFYYSDIRFALHQDPEAIIAQYPQRQQGYLQQLFAASSCKKKWWTLNLPQLEASSGHGRAVAMRALEHLQQQRQGELHMAGYRLRLRRTRQPDDLSALADQLSARFLQHEQREIERLHGMLAYAQDSGCRTQHLLAYFGESIPPCGHCDRCREPDIPAPPMPARRSHSIQDIDLAAFPALAACHPQALAQPRQQARFLCGISSPATSGRNGPRGHPLFASCAQVPFAQVLDWCSQQHLPMPEHPA